MSQKGKRGKQIKIKYLLKYNDTEYRCKTQQEMANICNRSRKCINRLINNKTTFTRGKKNDDDLKTILIMKL